MLLVYMQAPSQERGLYAGVWLQMLHNRSALTQYPVIHRACDT